MFGLLYQSLVGLQLSYFFHASTFLLPVSVNKSDVCDDGMRSSPAVGGDIDKNASLLGLQFWLGSGSDLVLK